MQEVKKFTLELDEFTISLYDKPPSPNNPKAATVVFLPGLAMDSHVWDCQFQDPLLDHLRLVAIELPGNGKFSRAKDPLAGYSFARLGGLIEQITNRLHIQDYVISAISLGANIALQALPLFSGCRGLFAIVVPFSKPANFSFFNDPSFLFENIYKEDVEVSNLNRYCELLVRVDTAAPSFLQDAFINSDPKFRSAIIAQVEQGAYEDENNIIEQANFPIAIVLGNDDQIYNTAVVRSRAFSKIWKHEIQWILNSGHLPQWENPGDVNSLLIDFIKEALPEAIE
jgi:pimeloyl-ACP methyl ester carboxylesterase